MPVRLAHDAQPPPNWPEAIKYLTRSRLSVTFPPPLLPLLYGDQSEPNRKFQPRAISHPATVVIKKISIPTHPAYGQNGLFTKRKLAGNELIIPYTGIIHASLLPSDTDLPQASKEDEHTDSDYDISLLRLSACDALNPYPGQHVSIGIDAAYAGNAGRFVNDFRGIASAPNAEFRLGKADAGESRMEIWTLKQGIAKGDEILVSYGKGWWGARSG